MQNVLLKRDAWHWIGFPRAASLVSFLHLLFSVPERPCVMSVTYCSWVQEVDAVYAQQPVLVSMELFFSRCFAFFLTFFRAGRLSRQVATGEWSASLFRLFESTLQLEMRDYVTTHLYTLWCNRVRPLTFIQWTEHAQFLFLCIHWPPTCQGDLAYAIGYGSVKGTVKELD